ncbi:hypothetical protein BC835DRAFT_67324 [Cytidiella melzeri]|nr:hypothetical protein BC835DRAFT_67324 [Cytidiella melzeri]
MSELLYYPLGSQQPLPIDLYSEPHPQRPQQNATGDFDFTSFETIGGQCTSQQPQDIQIQAFEADIDALDAILAQGSLDIDPTFLTNPSGIFEHIRTGTPTRGAPSTFTVSSESASAYESGYNESDSAYTYQSASELSALYEPFTTMNFQALGVTDSDFSTQSPNSAHSSPNSNIMNMALYSPPSYPPRGSYSDYEPTHIRVAPSSASDYYSQMSVPIKYPSSAIQATVSPANVSTQLPSAHQLQTAVLGSQQRDLKQENVQRSMNAKESKRKYQCPNCPRCRYLSQIQRI